MRKKVLLLLAVVAVLLAAYVFRRASAPSPVSGGDVRRPAAAAAPVPAPKPMRAAAPKSQPAKVLPSPAVEAFQPQPLVPTAATEAAPAVQEQPPSHDGAPQVEAIIEDAGNQFRALVGDALVSEGGMVQGFRVRKVQADSVVFEKDGQLWLQKLD